MNTGNSIVPTMESSLEIPPVHPNSLNSEREKNEQPEPSVSTSTTIPITTLISSAIGKLKGSDELFNAVGTKIELIERYFSEPENIKSLLLAGEVVFGNVLNVLNSLCRLDKEEVTTLKSQLSHYREFCIKLISRQKLLVEKWDRILNVLHRLSSENKQVTDVSEDMNISTELLIDFKHEVMSLCEEKDALVDEISSHLSHIEELCSKS